MLKIGKIWRLALLLLMTACARGQVYSALPAREACVTNETMEDVFMATGVSRSGVKYCPNTRRCTSDPLLPPQPCEQPMPTYYDNISEVDVAQGLLLIHPMTRAKVLCVDQTGMSAVNCAERFRAEGYVLITDVPQFAGRYDFLKEGTYPTRRWRKGEKIPRW